MAAGQSEAELKICPDGTHLPAAEPLRVGELKLEVSAVWVGDDAEGARKVLNFLLSTDGAKAFGRYTQTHLGEKVDVILGDVVLMSARISAPIWSGAGQVSGDFTAEELEDFAARLMPTCSDE